MHEAIEELSSKSMDSLETKSISLFSNADSDGYSDLSAVVSPRLLKSIYQSEDWIFILVDRIASKLSQIPWHVMRQTMKEGEQVLEPAFGHPVQRMLDEPNPLQPSYGFKYACITDLVVTGNAIIYFSPFKSWLVQIPAEIIWMDIDGRGDLRGYDIVGVNPTAFPVGHKMRIPAKDIIHIKRPNPSSVYWGMSPLIPGANPSLFNKYSSEYLLNFYKRGAQPGMILELNEETSEPQAKKLLNSLESAYTGRANQRRSMVLPKGVKATTLAHTLADQQLIEYITNNRETLINIFGVPKHELSIADSGSLGSEEYKTALKNFWEGPLMSYGTMVETVMTARLGSALGRGYVIKLDYSQVPILQDDLRAKADTANLMLSTMTYNEVRQRIWKIPPIEGGDILRDLRPPPSPYGSFALPAPALTPPVAALEQKVVDDVRTQNLAALSAYTKTEDSKWFKESRDAIEEESKTAADKLEKIWLKLLEEQVVASVKILKAQAKEKAAEVPNKRKLRRDIDAAMDGASDEWEKGYVEALAKQIDIGYDASLSIPFNKPYMEGIEAIKARNANGRRAVLEARSIESFDQISRTTSEKIMKAIENGLKNSESVGAIADKIMEIGKVSAGRALTIARTETLTANSIGEAAATKDAAEVIDDLVKVWINAGDDRVRDSHKDHEGVGGEIVDQDQKFSNGLAYPRDTAGKAADVINCRCSMLLVSAKDLAKLGLKR